MSLRVRLDELLPANRRTRTAAGLRRLLAGDADHFVITNRNEPQAVLITVQRYGALLRREPTPTRQI